VVVVVVVVVVPASPLEQLGLIWNSHRENVVVGRVAGRAGAMRSIAPSMPPHVCPRQGCRRPTSRFMPQAKSLTSRLWRFTAKTIILLAAWWAAYSKGNARHRPNHAATRLRPAGQPEAHADVYAAGEVVEFALVAVYGLNNSPV
jgi:hypothetical protein